MVFMFFKVLLAALARILQGNIRYKSTKQLNNVGICEWQQQMTTCLDVTHEEEEGCSHR